MDEQILDELTEDLVTSDPGLIQNLLAPPKIHERKDGFYRLVNNVKSILPDMKVRIADEKTPDYKVADYGEPTGDAGLMLLAKLFLNKEVYTGVSGWDSCQINLDELIATDHYGLADD